MMLLHIGIASMRRLTTYIAERKGILKLTLTSVIPIVFAPFQHVKLPINVKIPVTV